MKIPPNFDNDADLELALRHSLQRVEPERDFSALVYSLKPIGFWMQWRGTMALAAVLVIMLWLPVGLLQYQARQRRGEEARAQLLTALRITQNKLQKTRQMVVHGLNRRNSL